jgi:hypothetical protein
MFGLIFDWVKNPSNILQASGTESHNITSVFRREDERMHC